MQPQLGLQQQEGAVVLWEPERDIFDEEAKIASVWQEKIIHLI